MTKYSKWARLATLRTSQI